MLENMTVHTFILENVDISTDEPGSNYDLICQALSNASGGYLVRVFKLSSVEYGLPQRRNRLFFVGVSKDFQDHVNFERMEKTLYQFRLKHQKPDLWVTCENNFLDFSFWSGHSIHVVTVY